MRSLLDHQADGIEYTLHSHGIEASVVGGNISPRLIQFHIKLGAGVKYNRVAALSDELALALGVVNCRITRDGYYVKVEVPRPDPVAVHLFPVMRNLPGELPPNSPILGLDENGVPLLLRLDSPDIAHIMISGTTGSGKTVLARSMIASLALQNPPEDVRMLLIDPKGRGYRDFNGLPNLICPVVTDPQDGLHRLRWAVRHMEKRDESGVSTPLLVIFIDELADLIMVGGKEMEYLVTRLTQRGREAGIHVVACTQKPSASVIGGIAKSNFPTRVVGKVVSPEDARLASGMAGSGAEKLMGRGDFLLFTGGETTRVQSAHISRDEMVQTVVHLGGDPYVEESNPQTTRAARPAARQETRRVAEKRPAYQYEESYEDEFEEETPAYLSRREFRSAASNDYAVEKAGVAERLENYRSQIEQRRRTVAPKANPPAPADPDDEMDFEEPAPPAPRRTRQAQRVAAPAKTNKLDLWEELSGDLEDFEESEEAAPSYRPRPRTSPGPTPPGKPGSPDSGNGRDLMKNLRERSNSYKVSS
ncbi:MAG TPA: DNA translocase FtsK [Chloroflexia bacterium]|nr:DNA translocase FtsK [Chloroflexia bacterium]